MKVQHFLSCILAAAALAVMPEIGLAHGGGGHGFGGGGGGHGFGGGFHRGFGSHGFGRGFGGARGFRDRGFFDFGYPDYYPYYYPYPYYLGY